MDQKPSSEENLQLSNERTYDSTLAATVNRLDAYVVPLINELFGQHFPEQTK